MRAAPCDQKKVPENDAVAVEQHDVVLTAVDDFLEVVFEGLLDAVDDALENDHLGGAVGRSAGGGERLQQRRCLRAAELHATGMHYFAENVDVDRAVDGNVDDVVRARAAD